MPGAVTLRSAMLADLELLGRWGRNPDIGDGLIAEDDGRPIGFIRIIDPEGEDCRYWGCMEAGHRAIDIGIGEADARGRGYGTRMMEVAVERCFADPSVHTVLVDPPSSDTRAHRFFERLGFEFVVERSFGDHACRVYRLTRGGAAAPN